ncbi:hypothetical protein MHB50_18770 [Siminovitchia sp. FSL H7-0308]|jgi:dihydroorotase-like cyclic amidohydrolase|uniref:Dihydroorotase-like cyclic amidohydrolase n=1 Tax=Siminovitchia thermophila TaxID=1245522 RepID=A0ABS2RAE1_9BACI|nr:hypothetical protein [Siminovitchia thermophila]MBM7716164.1 dihydroorotase-like cyclic amidohydrolase [Siminovitchia thermophila]
MERVVKVYSTNARSLNSMKEKMDIQDTEYGSKVLFDLDGKWFVIYATVVTEEK